MKVEMWPASRPIPYARNPRKNDAAVGKVKASIAEFGFRQPIVVDSDGVIIVGHTRWRAAVDLGLDAVPVHVAEGLTPAQIKAYRLADNRVSQEATWDNDLLALEVADLAESGYSLDLTGFNVDELAAITAAAGIEAPLSDPDEVPPTPAVPVSRLGDVYELGRHRLIIGDATKLDTWVRLMAGARADMVWTDPPYGVSYVGKTRDKLTLSNDQLSVPQLTAFLRSAFKHTAAATCPGAVWYVAAPHGPQFLAFATVLFDMGVWRQTLVWVKDSFVLGRSDYHYRHEAIIEGRSPDAPPTIDLSSMSEPEAAHRDVFYGWTPGAAHAWHGGRGLDTVLAIDRPKRNAEHPTMKPTELIRACFERNGKPADHVLDPFGGSGSTLVAAELSGRTAYICELDPAYGDVIVQRWEAVTGKQAKRFRTDG